MPAIRALSRRFSFLVLTATLFVATVHADTPPAESADSLKSKFTAISGKILEAIRLGDKKELEKYLAPDMVLINRDGKEYPRQELLDDLVPPREGYDLRFDIQSSRVIPRGESALFTFALDEHLVIFGQDVSTAYRNHFLFHRIDGTWKLALYSYWEKPSEPPVIQLDDASMNAMLGRYELAPGKWITHITREGDKLFIRREGSQAREFLPMSGERFYVKGVEAEYFFERNQAGKPTALVFRRNWKDLRFKRLD